MKKNTYILVLLAMWTLMSTSCSESKLDTYSGGSYIQFDIYKYASDTLQLYTFAYDPDDVQETRINLTVQALGDVVDYDRPFVLRQVEMPDETNATPGTDYQAFDSQAMKALCVIKAGEASCEVPITIYRSDKQEQLMLKIEFDENEYFRLGDEKYQFRMIQFTSGLQRPASWQGYQISYYYGKYSLTKHKWMIEVTGKRWDTDYCKNVSNDEFKYQIGRLKKLLKQINAERAAQGLGPWCDEDGEEIAFGKYF